MKHHEPVAFENLDGLLYTRKMSFLIIGICIQQSYKRGKCEPQRCGQGLGRSQAQLPAPKVLPTRLLIDF